MPPYTATLCSFDSEVLSALEQAAAPVWTMVDNFTTLLTEHKNAHDDALTRLKAMRGSLVLSLQLLQRLRAFERTMCDKIEQFAREIGRLETHTSRTALNYGLNLLPDEVLSEIFALAAATLEDKVAVSLVCKRFRGVMMSMRKMWDGYWIESTQPREEIIAIAEGNGFSSLKARIVAPDTCFGKRVRNYGWYCTRYYKFAVGLILSFEPEELEFSNVTGSDWKPIEPSLANRNMWNLRRLTVLGLSRYSDGAGTLGRCRMPLLQDLEVDFVPGAALGRNLVRCSLHNIKEDQSDSLREFLGVADSLQDLGLFILNSTTPRFHEAYDLPSLRRLAVNFVPNPYLARRLHRFQLSPEPSSFQDFPLSELLDFLSSSQVLEELVIHDPFGDASTNDVLPVLTMSNIVSCEVQGIGPTLIARLRMPNLRKLKLPRLEALPTVIRSEFRASLQSASLLEVLELNGEVAACFLDEIVRYAPPHLESFLLNGCRLVGVAELCWSTSLAPNRKLIHFNNCKCDDADFMPTFVNYLRAVGLGEMKIQLSYNKEWRDGTFGLDEIKLGGCLLGRIGF